jgi:hypothetical protein
VGRTDLWSVSQLAKAITDIEYVIIVSYICPGVNRSKEDEVAGYTGRHWNSVSVA